MYPIPFTEEPYEVSLVLTPGKNWNSGEKFE
jgi:hypothetical protein